MGVVAFIWGVAAFGLGTWFGHRLAKSRDRRKEFNVIADPIELFLMAEQRRLKIGNAGHWNVSIKFDGLTLHLPTKGVRPMSRQ